MIALILSVCSDSHLLVRFRDDAFALAPSPFLYICIEKYIIKKMKKLMMVALCALGFAVSASAQDTFRRGDKVLNVGIGVPAENYVDLPPLSATYEQSIADNIGDKGSVGLGAQLEFMGAAKRVAIFMGPRAAFHYELQ